MRLGALLGPIADPGQANALKSQMQTLVAAGFDSLWTGQAVGRGFMITDPLTTLAVAATATDEIELGTAILQLPLYNSADLAHRILSVRQLCGKRLLLGVGAGSTEADYQTFARDYRGRFKEFDRSVADLREAFATGEVGGQALNIWPSVLGGPPLLLGTWGKGVEQAATDYDGWIASAMHRTPDAVAAALARYRAKGGGRAIVSTIAANVATDLGELQAKLDQFAEVGFDDAVVLITPDSHDLDTIRKLVN